MNAMARSGGVCEFCGSEGDVAAVEITPAGDVAQCAACRGEEDAPTGHWRCLEGAAWSAEPVVQFAVWRKLGEIAEPWAAEARDGMILSPEAEGWAAIPVIEHKDCHGARLAQGDTVVLVKDLVVKGAGFTAKRGTAVRGISLVSDNAGQIEGRVEGQRIVILTEFVKKK